MLKSCLRQKKLQVLSSMSSLDIELYTYSHTYSHKSSLRNDFQNKRRYKIDFQNMRSPPNHLTTYGGRWAGGSQRRSPNEPLLQIFYRFPSVIAFARGDHLWWTANTSDTLYPKTRVSFGSDLRYSISIDSRLQ
jgi:hypothetical protein